MDPKFESKYSNKSISISTLLKLPVYLERYNIYITKKNASKCKLLDLSVVSNIWKYKE